MKEKQGVGNCLSLPMQFFLYNIQLNNNRICERSHIFLQACYHISSVCNESWKELSLIPNTILQLNFLYTTELTECKSSQSREPTGEWAWVKAGWHAVRRSLHCFSSTETAADSCEAIQGWSICHSPAASRWTAPAVCNKRSKQLLLCITSGPALS